MWFSRSSNTVHSDSAFIKEIKSANAKHIELTNHSRADPQFKQQVLTLQIRSHPYPVFNTFLVN